MKLLFYREIVSISDWRYTKSVAIKNQVFLTSPCSYTNEGNNPKKRLLH